VLDIHRQVARWVGMSVLLLYCHPKLGAAAQELPTIRTSSSLVLVPVSPLDKSDRFVSGLSVQDFQILVDGKPVRISSFDIVTEDSPPPSPKETARIAARKFVSNISDRTVSQSNLVILLVDYLNTSIPDRMSLRAALLKYFSKKLNSNQEIGIFGWTRSLVLVQPFTRDSSQLVAAANEMLKQKGQSPDPKVSRPLDRPGKDPREIIGEGADSAIEYFTLLNARREYNIDQLQRAAQTLRAFRELAESFGGIPGKKTLIWLTGDASPLNPTLLYRDLPYDKSVETEATSWWQIAKTYELLNSAGVSVFPVDVRGLGNSGNLPAGESLTHEEFQQSVRGSQAVDMSPYSSPTDFRQGEAANAVLAMDGVAAETGAALLAGNNDVGALIDRAQRIWSNYYVLTFVPESSTGGRRATYHKLKVRINRHGLKVLARRGFSIRPEELISAETEIQHDLEEATNSPIDSTSVRLQLSLGEATIQDQTRHVPFGLTIAGSVIGAVSYKGAPYDISVAVVVRDQDGKIISAVGKRIKGSVPSVEAAQTIQVGLKREYEFQAPGRLRLYFGRVIVRDNLTGRVGTISVKLPLSLEH
jgi:VWFA-related protein